MFRVIVLPRAWQDFFDIYEYIKQDNPEAARRFGAALIARVDSLALFPHLGRPVYRGTRKLLHEPIRIYYRVLEDEQIVEVLSFLAQRSARARRSGELIDNC